MAEHRSRARRPSGAVSVDSIKRPGDPDFDLHHDDEDQPQVHAPEGAIAAMGPHGDDEDFPVERADYIVAPGEHERGHSAEVVSRHPAVIAAKVHEMVGGARRSTRRTEGIDPHDRAALEGGIREIGFHEIRKQDLINRAQVEAFHELCERDQELADEATHTVMAGHEILDDMDGYLSGRSAH